MKTQTPTPLATVHVLIPRKGRGKPFEADVVGNPEMVPQGEQLVAAAIDTSVLVGTPMGNLIALCQQKGLDPSQALAEGFNILSMRLARQAMPTLSEKLINEGLAQNAQEARIMSILVHKTARKLGVESEEVVATFQVLKERGEALEAEAPEQAPAVPAPPAAPPAPPATGHRLVRRAG